MVWQPVPARSEMNKKRKAGYMLQHQRADRGGEVQLLTIRINLKNYQQLVYAMVGWIELTKFRSR